MVTKRIIDCIGASDEETAHLRLLLRSAMVRLNDIWKWGQEAKADLVVVDSRSLIGDSALRRTRQRGVACAQLIDAVEPVPEGLFLRRPFRRDDFIGLLNSIGEITVVAPIQLVTQGDDFFNLDLGEQTPDDSGLPELDFSINRNDREREQDSFESLFHRDPDADKPQFLMPEKLDIETGVEFIRDTTELSRARADAYGNPFVHEKVDDATIDPSFRRDMELRAEANESHPLMAYLEPGLLGGPALIQLPDTVALVLDPKDRVFHADGKLPALAAYFRQPLRQGDWKRLVSSELREWRKRALARPYQRLVWMDRYLQSDGYLSKHLDPAGSYRLTRWLELAQDYPRAFRIGANMIVPQRLDQIARVSDVTLAEVFNVVNAYEAIGYVEWTRRQRIERDHGDESSEEGDRRKEDR